MGSWNILDFCIVMTSVISMIFSGCVHICGLRFRLQGSWTLVRMRVQVWVRLCISQPAFPLHSPSLFYAQPARGQGAARFPSIPNSPCFQASGCTAHHLHLHGTHLANLPDAAGHVTVRMGSMHLSRTRIHTHAACAMTRKRIVGRFGRLSPW